MASLAPNFRAYMTWGKILLLIVLLLIGTVGIPYGIHYFDILHSKEYAITGTYYIVTEHFCFTLKQEYWLYGIPALWDSAVLITFFLHFILSDEEQE